METATVVPKLGRLRERASDLGSGLLLSGLWGFEREALRVDREGRPSDREHPFPPERGDITVDFAENQVELVTSPRPELESALAELEGLHREAYAGLGGELLWPLSVPGRWDEPERLRPASFAGRPEKEEARRYRAYLLERYGRARQAITGLHYNFSLGPALLEALRAAEGSEEGPGDFSDRRYFDLARNFLRFRFLPVYLFAASPTIDPRFELELEGTADPAARGLGSSCRGRQASLRLGPLGYRLAPRTARMLDLRFESLGEYLAKVGAAVSKRGPGASLRSEGELYSPLRPKAAFPGEKGSLAALEARGVDYLELRVFDLDPFEPAGIGLEAARLVQLLSLACLLLPSPPLERDALADDLLATLSTSCSLARSGDGGGEAVRAMVAEWAEPVLDAMGDIAGLLPAGYGRALEGARDVLSGRRPRSAERFAELAGAMGGASGGGLAAGLALARAHEARYLAGASPAAVEERRIACANS
jgi:glutamate--cysteine ligase